MRILLLFASLTAGAINFALAKEATLKTSSPKTEINAGESFQVNCRVTNLGSTVLRIAKVVPNKDNPKEYDIIAPISSYDMMEDDYKPLKDKYKVTIPENNEAQDIFTFRLTVTDAQVEDGGVYQCDLLGKKMQDVKIVVRTPPKELKLFYYNITGNTEVEHEIKGGEDFTFGDKDKARIKCMVSGGNPEPMARIEIGGRQQKPDHGLIITPPIMKDTTDEANGDRRLGRIKSEYETILEIPTLDVSSHGNQMLKCAAHTHHMNPPELYKEFKLKMDGMKPVFNCEETQLVYLYQRNAKISCIVTSMPPPTKFSWFTYQAGIEEESQKINLNPNERNSNYLGTTKKLADGSVNMTIQIDRIFGQHMRPHWFVAENSKGKTEFRIDLIEDPNVEPYTSAAATRCSSSVHILIVALLSSVLHKLSI